MRLISNIMTHAPETISPTVCLREAIELMQSRRFRHLPVVEGGKLIGVLSDRDTKVVSSLEEASAYKVRDRMTPNPFRVSPDTPAWYVISAMTDRKIGSAMIVNADEQLVGIFTLTDGMRLLSRSLNRAADPLILGRSSTKGEHESHRFAYLLFFVFLFLVGAYVTVSLSAGEPDPPALPASAYATERAPKTIVIVTPNSPP